MQLAGCHEFVSFRTRICCRLCNRSRKYLREVASATPRQKSSRSVSTADPLPDRACWCQQWRRSLSPWPASRAQGRHQDGGCPDHLCARRLATHLVDSLHIHELLYEQVGALEERLHEETSRRRTRSNAFKHAEHANREHDMNANANSVPTHKDKTATPTKSLSEKRNVNGHGRAARGPEHHHG